MHFQGKYLCTCRPSAFSLVEVLVVVAIMALLLGLGVPAVSSITKSRDFSGDVQNFADTLAFARSHALARGSLVDVAFQSDEGGIVILVGERESGEFHPIARAQTLAGARIEDFQPTNHNIPAVEDTQKGNFQQVVRFNGRGEARVRTNGVDREVTIDLMPNINGGTPEALRDNRVEIVIHGLSGGISLVRDAGDENL